MVEQQINTEYTELKAKIETIEIALAQILAQIKYRTKIIRLKDSKEIHYIYVCMIDSVQVYNHICTFLFNDKTEFKYVNTLNNVRCLLSPYFEQINRNTIVNINEIDTICHQRHIIKLKSGVEYTCSEGKTSKIEHLLDVVNGIFRKNSPI